MIQQITSWPLRCQGRSRYTTKTTLHWNHLLLLQGAILEGCPGYWGFTLLYYKTELLTTEKTQLMNTMLQFLYHTYFHPTAQSTEKSTFQDLLLLLSCCIDILNVSKEMAWHKPTVKPMGNFVHKTMRISWGCMRSTWLTELSVSLANKSQFCEEN